MKKKDKTYTFSWWIGGNYVTLTFNSMEDMHKCLDYIKLSIGDFAEQLVLSEMKTNEEETNEEES